MKKALYTVVALGALAVAQVGFAQEVKPMGLSLRAGVIWPTSGDARDEGKTWFGAGLEYKLGDLNFGSGVPGMSSSYSISVDWYGKGDFRNVPVLLNYVGRQDQIFYTVGVGAGFARYPRNVAEVEDEVKFAYQFGIGYDIQRTGNPIFIEAKYFGTTESKVNAFGVFIGIRF